jgi:hypothetical protein
MATSLLRWIAVSLIAVVAVAGRSARAGDIARVRIESTYLQSIVSTAVDRSPTLRGLIDRIDASNVIVYVTCEHFRSLLLRGQTILMSGTATVRYVRVQIDCMLPATDLAAIVGHELHHVNEIAAAGTIVDSRSLRLLYGSIGFVTCGSWQSEHFETIDAVHAGERVREEYLGRGRLSARAVKGRPAG